MNTLSDVAAVLRDALVRQGLTQGRLAERSGVSPRTLSNVLSGEEDFRLSTLFALADRLELELVLVPRAAAAAVAAGETTAPLVPSMVDEALLSVRERLAPPLRRRTDPDVDA